MNKPVLLFQILIEPSADPVAIKLLSKTAQPNIPALCSSRVLSSIPPFTFYTFKVVSDEPLIK